MAFKKPVFQERQKLQDFPQLKDFFAVVYVTLTMVLMAYSSEIGIGAILLFYAIWFPHIKYKGCYTLRLTKEIYLPLTLASLYVISTLWSAYREVTLKASLEATTMIACSIIIARITTLESFLKGVAAGASLVLIASLIDGHYGIDYFTGTTSLIGLLGSKNQVGFNAEIGIFAAVLFLFSDCRIVSKITFSLCPLLICLVSLYLARSASSVVTLAITFAVWGCGYVLLIFPSATRKYILLSGLFLIVLVSAVSFYMGFHEAILGLFGKNSTLTGRTYLWQEGIAFGRQHLLLGTGFNAFWVQGQPLAELLWFKFDIASRVGFHFHNVFVQTFVDLGLVGVFIIVSIILMNCMKSMNYLINKRHGALLAFYALGISFMFAARAFVEVDIGATFFGIGPIFLFSILPRLASPQTSALKADEAAPVARFLGRNAPAQKSMS